MPPTHEPQGGDSLLVSALSVFNAMRQRAPHLLARLLQPMPHDRRGEVPQGQLPFFDIPVFSWWAFGCMEYGVYSGVVRGSPRCKCGVGVHRGQSYLPCVLHGVSLNPTSPLFLWLHTPYSCGCTPALPYRRFGAVPLCLRTATWRCGPFSSPCFVRAAVRPHRDHRHPCPRQPC